MSLNTAAARRRAALLALPLLVVAGCAAPGPYGQPGSPLQRSGDEIIVCGKLVHTGAPVVLWLASDLCGERTGLVVGAAGSRVSSFRMLESQGRTKESRGIWSPEEIGEHWDSIAKLRL